MAYITATGWQTLLYIRDLHGRVQSVGRHELPTAKRPKRRWSSTLVAVVVPAVAFLTAGAGTHAGVTGHTVCCAEIVAAPHDPVSAGALRFVVAAPGESMVVSARALARDARYVLPAGVASEKGLQVKTILAARAVSAMFPEILNIGGVRPDSLRWHPNGLALDVMIPNYRTAEGKALGDRIAAYALANADRFGLDHVIWRQVLYMPSGATRMMGNYGSDDANHYTHVHIATDGGGYPSGHETYFTSSEGGPAMSEGSAIITVVGRR